MKVNVISRNVEEFTRERKVDLRRVHRNVDPSIHPFEKAREYTRALNATKVDKIYAKPFLAALSGHTDGVFCMAKHPSRLSTFLSGSCDGEVKVWNLSTKQALATIPAHAGFVRGLVVASDGNTFLSCGDDQTVKQWSLEMEERDTADISPINTFLGKNAFSGLDYRLRSSNFVTSGTEVDVWDVTRSEPIQTYSWGCDSILTVKYNPIETHVLASSATDRNVVLYDTRGNTPVKKMILAMKTNAIAWNPMEAFNFTLANEDHNCYTFDMRRLDIAQNVHKDHVSAVLDIDYSPTGQEFATGSYDRTLRIFPVEGGRSREVYHTKRMQRIFCIKFTSDSRYVLTGSDDTNIRLWKAQASAPVKILNPREKQKLEYNEKLKQRYRNLPEVKRIERHRHVPKSIHLAQKLKVTMKTAQERKETNRRAHSKPDSIPRKKERSKNIIETVN